jgi:hypothetical protein
LLDDVAADRDDDRERGAGDGERSEDQLSLPARQVRDEPRRRPACLDGLRAPSMGSRLQADLRRGLGLEAAAGSMLDPARRRAKEFTTVSQF